MKLEGKIALVTGGRSGIGKAIADRLADEGAKVFTAQRGADETHHAIEADLANPQDCGRVISSIIDDECHIDVLVNNAGIMQEADVVDCPLEDWDRAMAINLRAPFLLAKHAIPHMKPGSAIVNIGSIEGLGSNPKHPAYCASKSGLHALTRAIAVDHGAQGIRCNCVAPGWIDTELNEEFIGSMPDPKQFRERIGDIHPAGRTGTPQEVANMVVWLASEQSSFVTGQTFVVDGGRTSKLSLPHMG